ncbi:hypothetical protein FRB90_000001 [Tulasnella sp. 427]|nr:hypothetical protein FRB90_000001 [Tulasnella sp. 427]
MEPIMCHSSISFCLSAARICVARRLMAPFEEEFDIISPTNRQPEDHYELDTAYRPTPAPQSVSFLELTLPSTLSETTEDEPSQDGDADSQTAEVPAASLPYTVSAPGNLEGGIVEWLYKYKFPTYYNNYHNYGPLFQPQVNPQVPISPSANIDGDVFAADMARSVRQWAEEEVWAGRIVPSQTVEFNSVPMSQQTIFISSSMIRAPIARTIEYCEWLAEIVWNELRAGYALHNGERIAADQLPLSCILPEEDLRRSYTRLRHFATTWLPYHLPKHYRKYKLAHIFDLRHLPLGAAVWSYEERTGPCLPPMSDDVKTIRELIYGQGCAYDEIDRLPEVSALRLVAYLIAIHFKEEPGLGRRIPQVSVEDLFGCGLLQQVIGMSVGEIAEGAQVLSRPMPDLPVEGLNHISPWEQPLDGPSRWGYPRNTA